MFEAITAWLPEEEYETRIEWLIEHGIYDFAPEVLLMHVAYDRLSDAYCNAYSGLRLVMGDTAEKFGWEAFTIHQAQVRDYMDRYFLEYLAGEQRTLPKRRRCCSS